MHDDDCVTRRQHSRLRLGTAVLTLTVLALAALAAPLAQAETRSYVMSLIVPAMYAYEGDCKALEPIADPGFTPVESMYRRMLIQLGYSPEEVELNKTLSEKHSRATDILVNRGRLNGQPVNAYQNPETVPDPLVNTVVGRYGIGFNLDGQGAGATGSFEDPYTHEQGVDNQVYRAYGCFRSARVTAPVRSGHWEEVWLHNVSFFPAVLISVSGKDLSRDGEVTVTFARSIDRTRKDALSKVRRDMTFRADPNPLARSVLPGRIENGVLLVKGGSLKMEGAFVTTPFDVANTHIRFTLKPDGTLEGLLAGYQPWRAIYHYYNGHLGIAAELNVGMDVPGVYHALKKLADSDPDPATGQNRRISITYYLQAVPAFLGSGSEEAVTTSTAADVPINDIPMATPTGITIQIPAGSEKGYNQLAMDGRYFADAQGNALYTSDDDLSKKSTCYEACAQEWPPLIAKKGAKAFGEWSLVARRDGGKQWAYLGKPLYRFAKDSVVGDTKGVPTPETEKNDDPAKSSTSPWKLASYKLAGIAMPHGITLGEVADANGEVLVDLAGRTLYTLNSDGKQDNVSCQAPCTSPWIPIAAGRLANPVGNFTLIRRKDGITQWAYKGKSLYKYRGDLEPGHAKGIGVDKRWQVALLKQFYMPSSVRIQESAGRGKVLVDERGMTLYRRSGTVAYGMEYSVPIYPEEGRVIGTRSCDAQCMKTWIPFEAPADAQSSGFWEVRAREDGKKQWSYKGYALYRYAGDKQSGDINGTLLHEPIVNARLEAKPDAASQVAFDIKWTGSVALIWSHMFP